MKIQKNSEKSFKLVRVIFCQKINDRYCALEPRYFVNIGGDTLKELNVGEDINILTTYDRLICRTIDYDYLNHVIIRDYGYYKLLD